MKIVLTFDSFEEFQKEVSRYAAKLRPAKPEAVPLEDVAAVLKAEAEKKPEPKKDPAPASDPEPAQAPEPPQISSRPSASIV